MCRSSAFYESTPCREPEGVAVAGLSGAFPDGSVGHPGSVPASLRATRTLVIFGWHNVAGTSFFHQSDPGGIGGLRRQLTWLSRAASVVALSDAVACLAGGRALPRRAVAITFDDGYRDNLDHAVPILEELGLPATFFLVPELLTDRVTPWWERLAWAAGRASVARTLRWRDVLVTPPGLDRGDSMDLLYELLKAMDEQTRRSAVDELVELFQPVGAQPPSPIMDWDDARELVRRGFTVGSHSMRHSILANEAPAAQASDLAESRAHLEAGTGARVDLLAYPNGSARDFDKVTVAAALEAGYCAGVTTIPGWNGADTPLMELRRFVLSPESGPAGLATIPRHMVRAIRSRRRDAILSAGQELAGADAL